MKFEKKLTEKLKVVEGPHMTPLEEKIAESRRNEIATGERLSEIVKEAALGA